MVVPVGSPATPRACPVPVFAGLATDAEAGQQWRDLFTRLRRPSEVFTAERLSRWADSLAGPPGRLRRRPPWLTWPAHMPTLAEDSSS